MKKAQNIYNILIILIFLIGIFVPLLFINFKQGVISSSENRYLTNIPHIYLTNGKINKDFPKQFENYFNDNMGFRNQLLRINRFLIYYIFGISPIKDLYVGKDEWLFLVSKNRLDFYQNLNTPDTQNLQSFAYTLEKVDSYLSNRNIKFVTMLWPNKLNVYPEYVPSSILRVENISNADVVINYMNMNTNLDFSMPLEALLQEKEKRIIYSPRNDASHWNNYGAFIGYSEFMKKVKEHIPAIKILTLDDFNITPFEKVTSMFGVKNIKETDYNFELKGGYHAVSDKTFFEESGFSSTSKDQWKSYNHYINSDKSLPKALIVGDSFTWMYLLPNIAESFSELTYIHYLDAESFSNLINYFNPDIVIYATLENDFSGIMNVSPEMLTGYDSLAQLPVMAPPQEFGLMWLDYCNKILLKKQGEITINPSQPLVTMSGWALDPKNNSTADSIYITVGDKYYKGNYGIERTSVTDYFKNNSLTYCGFNFYIKTEDLIKAGKFSFFIIAKDKTYQYGPVEYKVLAK